MTRDSSPDRWSLSSLRSSAIDFKVLVASLSVLAVLCAYRFYSYWTTGFFVSDEFGYYYDAAHGAIYGDRWFFGWVNIFLFKALGITSPDSFSYLLPFYMMFWTALTFVIIFKLLRLLEFDATTISLTMISSFVLISFVLLALGFLTEPVGLSMAMAGIYFLARFMKTNNARGRILFPILSASFFGFAAGTREPYNAFLVGGILVTALLAVGGRRAAGSSLGRRAMVIVPIAAFIIPALFFLVVPTEAYSQQVAPITSQIAQSLITNPVTSPVHITSTVTSTVTQTINNTVTTTTTTSTVVSTPTYPFYKEFVLSNMLLIFFGGIVLGWGPICVLIGAAGFLILFRSSIRKGGLSQRFLFLTSVLALASYLVVSFIYAPDPTYFSFSNYSTLIRFSDTALPAYFLMAPLVMSYFAKDRRRALSLVAVFVAFLLIAVPVYEIYAASNFTFTSSANPFQPGYRSDAAALRDYLGSLPGGQIDLVGVPYGWTFTPGVQDLGGLRSFAIGPNSLVPELGLANLTSFRWTGFYVFLMKGQVIPSNQTFLAQILNSTTATATNQSLPFSVLGSHPVLAGPDFTLYQVDLEWA